MVKFPIPERSEGAREIAASYNAIDRSLRDFAKSKKFHRALQAISRTHDYIELLEEQLTHNAAAQALLLNLEDLREVQIENDRAVFRTYKVLSKIFRKKLGSNHARYFLDRTIDLDPEQTEALTAVCRKILSRIPASSLAKGGLDRMELPYFAHWASRKKGINFFIGLASGNIPEEVDESNWTEWIDQQTRDQLLEEQCRIDETARKAHQDKEELIARILKRLPKPSLSADLKSTAHQTSQRLLRLRLSPIENLLQKDSFLDSVGFASSVQSLDYHVLATYLVPICSEVDGLAVVSEIRGAGSSLPQKLKKRLRPVKTIWDSQTDEDLRPEQLDHLLEEKDPIRAVASACILLSQIARTKSYTSTLTTQLAAEVRNASKRLVASDSVELIPLPLCPTVEQVELDCLEAEISKAEAKEESQYRELLAMETQEREQRERLAKEQALEWARSQREPEPDQVPEQTVSIRYAQDLWSFESVCILEGEDDFDAFAQSSKKEAVPDLIGYDSLFNSLKYFDSLPENDLLVMMHEDYGDVRWRKIKRGKARIFARKEGTTIIFHLMHRRDWKMPI